MIKKVAILALVSMLVSMIFTGAIAREKAPPGIDKVLPVVSATDLVADVQMIEADNHALNVPSADKEVAVQTTMVSGVVPVPVDAVLRIKDRLRGVGSFGAPPDPVSLE